ncbi:MAG: hypothetical protein QXV63_00590 [Candidatus Aenigmatarchaeota archaeon]|nr:hypothetical protein [Candidatus Aenigmarchaeota archaeon]
MSFLIVLIFAVFYSFLSSIIDLLAKKDEKVQKIAKKIENYLKKNLKEKVFENYLKLLDSMKKYIILNIFIGVLVFLILLFLLNNTQIWIPFLNISISWFWIYIILYLIFKYFFELIFKAWGKK